MKSLTISYVGNFEPRHSTETHIARTLEEDLGHRVLRLQENEVPVEQIEALTRNVNADLLLYTRTWGFQGNGLALLNNLHASNIPTASYHLDLYWGIQREQTIFGDPFWNTKYVFTPDGASQNKFAERGINHHYIRPGVFRKECYNGVVQERFTSPVGFVGSLDTYHPEWLPYRQQLKGFLQSTFGDKFRWWPGDGPAIRNEELNDLYASIAVVVGDSLCVNFKREYYWSDRVYETIGRGGFLIHPWIKGLEDEFVDRKTIVFFEFGNWAQLRDLINYYLSHPEEREEIRAAGQDWVRNNGTYTNRLLEALSIMSDQEGWDL